MNKYLTVAMLIAGMLAITSIASAASSQSQPLTNTIPGSSSSFYTTTTNLGAATVTEILVNTAIQFPIANPTSGSRTSNLLLFPQLAFLLFMIAIAVGMRSTRGT